MKVDFNAINEVTKEITITVPAEDVQDAWARYLRKAARHVDVPGFRKGKAPLPMIERMYSESLKDQFYQESVNEYFDKVAREQEISYLLYPDLKDVQWEKGSEMTIKIEIEHEPDLEFKQLDNLDVPYHPITLESEVDKYLEELLQQNGRVVDAEEAIENDHVDCELTLKLQNEEVKKNALFIAGSEPERRALPELIGKKIGDVIETELEGGNIKLVSQDSEIDIENEEQYPVSVMVNAISRTEYPNLDDDFARDMEFDDMDAMRAKISDDMRLGNEHKNLDIKNYAIIGKLFEDNKFELPMKTIEYLATQEAEKHPMKEYHQFLKYQYQMQLSQEMMTMYILKSLREKLGLKITDEMIEEYITHEAILAGNTVEAYKESRKDEIAGEDYKYGVKNYFTLRKLAETANYYIPEPEEEKKELPETETEAVESPEPKADAQETAQD